MNKNIAEIMKLIGGLILILSAIVTFKFDALDNIVIMTNGEKEFTLDDIIYFRGILIGSLLMFVGSAITTAKFTIQNIYYSLALGVFALIIASTVNIINDTNVDLDLYFDITIIVILFSIIALTIIRLWWKRCHYLNL